MVETRSSNYLPLFGFSADAMTPPDNYAAWREATLTLFDVDLGRGAEASQFRADLESYAMGAVLFGLTRFTAQRFSRSTRTIARSGVDHVIVQLYRSGGFVGFAGEQPIEVKTGDICVFDLAQTLETEADGSEVLTLVVPRLALEKELPRPDALHGLVLPASAVMNQILARHFNALFELAPRMTFDECEAITNATVVMVIACLRGELEARDVDLGGPSALSIGQIRRYIEDNLADPALSVEAVARAFGLSRSSLYRLFEPAGGVAETIRAKRLHRAFFDLTSASQRNLRISEIARRWGFSSKASFTRAFTTAYGINPTVAREASMLGTRGMIEEQSDENTTLTRWMTTIVGTRSDA